MLYLEGLRKMRYNRCVYAYICFCGFVVRGKKYLFIGAIFVLDGPIIANKDGAAQSTINCSFIIIISYVDLSEC